MREKPISESLAEEIRSIATRRGATGVAVCSAPCSASAPSGMNAAQVMHAASTMKLAVMVSLMRAIDHGDFRLEDQLHVRDRFTSLHDGSPYRVGREDGANRFVSDAIGGMLSLEQLNESMITASGNLSTNLLVELLGAERVRFDAASLGARDLQIVRGVSDEAAWAAGINNTATAESLWRIVSAIGNNEAASPGSCEFMRQVLMRQRVRSGIPAGLPGTRVGNKTGDISTVVHDVAFIAPEGGEPHALVVMTEWSGWKRGRYDVVAEITRAVAPMIMPTARVEPPRRPTPRR
jgi:beta-lactamase class A